MKIFKIELKSKTDGYKSGAYIHFLNSGYELIKTIDPRIAIWLIVNSEKKSLTFVDFNPEYIPECVLSNDGKLYQQQTLKF